MSYLPVPKVLHYNPRLHNISRKQFMDKNKEALSTSPFEDGDGAFLDFRGKDVKPARSVLYLRNGNGGGIQLKFLENGKKDDRTVE